MTSNEKGISCLTLTLYRLTKTIADSSRIHTQKYFEREIIKQQIIRERDDVRVLTFILFKILIIDIETERSQTYKEKILVKPLE